MKASSDKIEDLASQLLTPISDGDSIERRARRLKWLSEKIDRGIATEEEIAEFQREMPRLIKDMNDGMSSVVEACTSAVKSVAENIAEPLEEIADEFDLSPSDQK